LSDSIVVMPTLKRASKHRPGGQWSGDDYDVFDGDRHIGRILLHPQTKARTGGKIGHGAPRLEEIYDLHIHQQWQVPEVRPRTV
jgi:hypothetical protein